jgi:chromosome segregation ATPase
MAGRADADPQALVQTVTQELAPYIEQLRAQVEQLNGRVARGKEELARIEGEARARTEAGQQVQALLQTVREAFEQELSRLRESYTQLQVEAERARTERAAAQASLASMNALAEERRRDIEHFEAVRAESEARVQALARQAEAEEQRLQALQTHVAEALAQRDEIAADVEQLRRSKREIEMEIEELQTSFRPLRPYRPGEGRPRYATAETQLNVKVQVHDARALRVYAQSSGLEMRAAVTEALRNYLPHSAYDEALHQLMSEWRSANEPAVEPQPDLLR